MANRDPLLPYEPNQGLSEAFPQDRKTPMQGQKGRSPLYYIIQLHSLLSCELFLRNRFQI